MLVSLLLDLNNVHLRSSTFIVNFENLFFSSITFACFYVVGIYLFSSAKATMLDKVCARQTLVLETIFSSKEAWVLVFHKGPIKESPAFPKFWVSFRLVEDT